MQNLNEFRKEVKKIEGDFNFKIKKFSDFKTIIFLCEGKEINGNIFSAERLKKLELLLYFLRINDKKICSILISENIVKSALLKF